MFEDEKREQSMNDGQNIENQEQEDIFAEPDLEIPQDETAQSGDGLYRMKGDSIRDSHQEYSYGSQSRTEQDETAQAENSNYQQNSFNSGNQTGQSGASQTENQNRQQYSYIPQDRQPQGGRGNNHPTKRNRKGRGFSYGKAVGCAVLCGVIIGGCIIGSFAIGKNVVPTTAVETTSAKLSVADSTDSDDTTAEATSSSSGTYTVAQIAEQCSSSVVAITSMSVSEVQTMFGTYEQESEGSSSGVIVSQTDTELLIATNYHVIEDSEELSVCFNDSEDWVYSAQVKGTSESDDLAVVAVQLSDMDEEVLSAISIATIGDSDSLQVGDEVVAIGNALGLGQSVTAGIISALDREVTIDDTTYTLLQTDAAINAGNSGGALFNMQGELIGINTAKFSSDSSSSSASIDNMGFAIPMSKAQSIIEELMTRETRTKLTENYGALNITGYDVSSDAATMYGMPEGVYVYSVVEGGAADNAGIQAGDIITALDGSSLSSISSLQEKLQYYAAGESVEVTLQRGNGNTYEEMTITVTLDNVSDLDTSSSTTDDSSTDSSAQDGADSFGNSEDNSGSGFSR
ncbi:MAG: trypsin-like peptidase domain-containing protein [Clostridiales bacterium]|nr:trypsin-like peptidase domain-containing protein [Clostridiales bacterium]